mmetsp:Transcript_3339/g.11906  ORF Transcript_3339/g.11906 Transcript_3339/m.11906 type:complete len:234 (-) Transcript_3339:476-1177(-)
MARIGRAPETSSSGESSDRAPRRLEKKAPAAVFGLTTQIIATRIFTVFFAARRAASVSTTARRCLASAREISSKGSRSQESDMARCAMKKSPPTSCVCTSHAASRRPAAAAAAAMDDAEQAPRIGGCDLIFTSSGRMAGAALASALAGVLFRRFSAPVASCGPPVGDDAAAASVAGATSGCAVIAASAGASASAAGGAVHSPRWKAPTRPREARAATTAGSQAALWSSASAPS